MRTIHSAVTAKGKSVPVGRDHFITQNSFFLSKVLQISSRQIGECSWGKSHDTGVPPNIVFVMQSTQSLLETEQVVDSQYLS